MANAALTAAQWNASVRDNLLETAPAKATGAGRLIVTTGANTVTERVPSTASVLTAQTTTSSTFTDLTTPGPAVTGTTGTTAIIMMLARASNGTVGGVSRFAVAVSGATTAAADPDIGFAFAAASTGQLVNGSAVYLHTGLTAGSNTFTMKYCTDGTGTGTFSSRRVAVVPL